MPTNFTKRLGYGGSALVDGYQVLITGGSMEQADSPSFLEMLDIEPTLGASRSRVLHADGVSVYTGSISYDVTENAMNSFSIGQFFKRRYQFNVGICDGTGGDASTDVKWTMKDCYLTSLTLAGAPGGFVNASLSIMSREVKDSSPSVTNDYILDDYYGASPVTVNQPLGYWWSGGPDIKEWTFTMNQAVEPMYQNKNVMDPKYLLVGLIDFQLEVTLYVAGTPSTIAIRTSSFTLTGVTTTKGYTFNGVTDLGMYSHTFVTAANAASGASGLIIT
jgi:hypothetical protein